MSGLSGQDVDLNPIKPLDYSLLRLWSVDSSESYFRLTSPLPLTSEMLMLEMKSPVVDGFIVHSKKGKPAGLIKAYNINEKANRASVSFSFKPSDFNAKYFSEALQILMDRLRTRRQITHYYCYCLIHEHELKKVIQKHTFIREGIFKEHLYLKNKYHDVEIFSKQLK